MIPIPIIYEDNHLLVVEKPQGIPSQEDETKDADMLTLLKEDLKQRYNKPGNVYLGLVHRLDRPVGGAMLFAKTSKAASRMSEAVRSRQFDKTYLCVVNGQPSAKEATLVHYLRKDTKRNHVTVFNKPAPEAKEAILDYRVIAIKNNSSLLAISLHTGRSHQIRAQLAHIGCPLAGDLKYGRQGKSSALSTIALWSTSITTAHPVTKQTMTFQSIPKGIHVFAEWSEDELQAAATAYLSSIHAEGN